MARLSAEQIYSYARQAGFPPNIAVAMTAISLRESGGNTGAYNLNDKTRDDSIGLWQINMRYGSNGSYTREQLYDPLNNARQAYNLWKSNGFQPWRPYQRFEWYQTVTGDPPRVVGNINFDAGLAAARSANETVTQQDIAALTSTSYSSGSGGASTQANDDAVKREIEDRYGAYMWLLDDKEVGSLVREAIAGGISFAEFQSRLQQTNWWRTRSESQRKWDATYATDPAEAARLLNQRRSDIQRAASTYGVNLSLERASAIAFTSLRLGWRDDEWQRSILGEARYQRRQGGQLGSTQMDVEQIAASYGVNAPDQRTFNFARDVLSGKQTMDGVKADYANQAKILFPGYREQLEAGATVRDIARPYLDQASRLLEIDPDNIDLTDPRFQRPLQGSGDKGKSQAMSMADWTDLLINDKRYGWESTKNARDLATQFADRIGSMFGGSL